MSDPDTLIASTAGIEAPLEPATLVIPTRDRPALLATALESIFRGDLLPDEILIVDQSSACDGSVEQLAATASIAVRHVHTTTIGVSRARNLGSDQASHEVLLFLDDDVLVDPDWCRTIRSSLAEAGLGAVVSGELESAEPEEPGAFAPSTTVTGGARRVFRQPGSVDVLYTGNSAMRRSTLRSVGGFDPRLGPGTRYPAAEDNDLAHRLLTSGVRVVFDPAARVLHRAWRPASDLAPLRWRYGRGQGAFLAKHLMDPGGATRRRLAGEIVRRARRIGQAAIRRQARVGPEIAYLAGLLSGAAEWIVRERVVDGASAIEDDRRPDR